MSLVPYTNTYTDVDTNIMDSDDLVEEFWRVAEFMNTWANSTIGIGVTNTYEFFITEETDIINVSPVNGVLQKIIVGYDVDNFAVNLVEREEGSTYRVYVTLRFENPDTTFTISGPSGQTHVFGVNRSTLKPSQTQADGYYTAIIIATYGFSNGILVNVFADNEEATAVGADDILTAAAS
jgi:hypothetical protein